ncbi:MAG: alpha/beta fold hydrolase, partial [Bacteroidota bacterium]
VNTVPLVIAAEKRMDCRTLMQQIASELRTCYRHKRFPLSAIAQQAVTNREQDQPLFEIQVSYEQQNFTGQIGDFATSLTVLDHQSHPNALSVFIREYDRTQNVIVDFAYKPEIFNAGLPMAQVMHYFQQTMTQMLKHPQSKLSEIDRLTQKEKANLTYLNDCTVIDLYPYSTIRTLNATSNDWYNNSDLLEALVEVEAPQYTLLCAPCGGGRAEAYLPLANALRKTGQAIDVYALDLPYYYEWEAADIPLIHDMAHQCLTEVLTEIQGPILVYGHAEGGALAYELTRQLEAEGHPILALGIGGMLAPRRVGEDHPEEVLNAWDAFSDQQLENYLRSLGSSDLQIADFRLDAFLAAEYFSLFDGQRQDFLKTPLYCVVGEQDPLTWAYGDQYQNWERYATAVKLCIIKGGNHYFVNDHAEVLAEQLIQIMTQQNQAQPIANPPLYFTRHLAKIIGDRFSRLR